MPTIIVIADGADGTKGWKKIRSNFVAKSNIWNTPRRTEEVSKRNLEGDIASLERVRPTCLTTKITSRTVKKDLVMG
jgi:hypothetical protein